MLRRLLLIGLITFIGHLSDLGLGERADHFVLLDQVGEVQIAVLRAILEETVLEHLLRSRSLLGANLKHELHQTHQFLVNDRRLLGLW